MRALGFRFGIAIVAISAFSGEVAHAYIDPGTGSYTVQIVAAAIGGAALAFRQLWLRVRASVSRPKTSKAHEASSRNDGDSRGENR
jgi:hypothetical protein